MRLHVMAALTFVDELDETRQRLEALEGELDRLKGRLEAGDQRAQASEILRRRDPDPHRRPHRAPRQEPQCLDAGAGGAGRVQSVA